MAQKELTVIVLKRQTVVMEKKMNAVCLKKIFFVIENTEEGMTTKRNRGKRACCMTETE